MTYDIQDILRLAESKPEVHQRALKQGSLDPTHTRLTLPDDFDFGDMKGLGDLIAMVAQPIARTIDRIAGTNLANCAGCSERKDALNQAFPIKHDA